MAKWEEGQHRWDGTWEHNNPLKAGKERKLLWREKKRKTQLTWWSGVVLPQCCGVAYTSLSELSQCPWWHLRKSIEKKQIVTYDIRAWHYTSQIYASWPREIWYSMRRHNPSGEHFERSILSSQMDLSRFFSPAGEAAFQAAATRWTSTDCKSRAHKCHFCLGKANVTHCLKDPTLPPSFLTKREFLPLTWLLAWFSPPCKFQLVWIGYSTFPLCWSVIKWGLKPLKPWLAHCLTDGSQATVIYGSTDPVVIWAT